MGPRGVSETQIPLFPLNAVLFPGGPLPLRIFETRYTDMVRKCMREHVSFGVVQIHSGTEAGEVASTADVGTQATIVDFNQLPDGLLGITCIGAKRFRVRDRWRAPDGLNMAAVLWLEEAAPAPVDDAHQHLAVLLRKLLPQLGEAYQFVQPAYDDAAWVGARLAEIIPVSLADKQRWLEMDDASARLDEVSAFIRRPES